MLEEFKALIALHPILVSDIDNVREDEHSNVLYDYDGFLTCAIVNTGAEFIDIGDVHPDDVVARSNGAGARRFDSLEELVTAIAEEVNPDNLP